MPSFRRLGALAIACSLCSCSRSSTPGTPTDPSTQVTPIENSGPTLIRFVSAAPAPGSTLTGCGTRIAGCRGRLRVTFSLTSASGGPVLYVRAYLHSMRNLQACLTGETVPFQLAVNAPTTVELTFDQADDCIVPDTMGTMAVVVEGPTQTASRQTWTLRYQFAP